MLPPEGKAVPVHVYLHGEFLLGSIEGSTSHAVRSAWHPCPCRFCRYRLAPSTGSLSREDCYAALCWWQSTPPARRRARHHLGRRRVGGRNLAAVCRTDGRTGEGRDLLQVLSVAVTDSLEPTSVAEFAEGYLLSRAGMRTQREHYSRLG